jgi:hypothetical protein
VLFLPRFWRFGGDEFLEARIIPKGIEHRIEPERARPNSSTRARELALNGLPQTFTVAFYGSKVFCRKTAQLPETARKSICSWKVSKTDCGMP